MSSEGAELRPRSASDRVPEASARVHGIRPGNATKRLGIAHLVADAVTPDLARRITIRTLVSPTVLIGSIPAAPRDPVAAEALWLEDPPAPGDRWPASRDRPWDGHRDGRMTETV
jgi:hypothetical protein